MTKFLILRCAFFQIPVVALVGNDACWSQIAREQVPMFGSDVACKLEVRDLAFEFLGVCLLEVD